MDSDSEDLDLAHQLNKLDSLNDMMAQFGGSSGYTPSAEAHMGAVDSIIDWDAEDGESTPAGPPSYGDMGYGYGYGRPSESGSELSVARTPIEGAKSPVKEKVALGAPGIVQVRESNPRSKGANEAAPAITRQESDPWALVTKTNSDDAPEWMKSMGITMVPPGSTGGTIPEVVDQVPEYDGSDDNDDFQMSSEPSRQVPELVKNDITPPAQGDDETPDWLKTAGVTRMSSQTDLRASEPQVQDSDDSSGTCESLPENPQDASNIQTLLGPSDKDAAPPAQGDDGTPDWLKAAGVTRMSSQVKLEGTAEHAGAGEVRGGHVTPPNDWESSNPNVSEGCSEAHDTTNAVGASVDKDDDVPEWLKATGVTMAVNIPASTAGPGQVDEKRMEHTRMDPVPAMAVPPPVHKIEPLPDQDEPARKENPQIATSNEPVQLPIVIAPSEPIQSPAQVLPSSISAVLNERQGVMNLYAEAMAAVASRMGLSIDGMVEAARTQSHTNSQEPDHSNPDTRTGELAYKVLQTPSLQKLILASQQGEGRKVGREWSTKDVDVLAACGHLALTQQLELYGQVVSFKPESGDMACRAEDPAMLEWLLSSAQCKVSSRGAKWAAQRGRVKILRWLHENGHHQVFTTEVMDTAAEFGHLNVLELLYKIRREGCSTKALDRASANGHLKVVKWLLENTYEGCSHLAVDMAAIHGHIEIVKLLTNYKKIATSRAIDGAARNGHLVIIKYLREKFKLDCTERAFEEAAAFGHVNVLEYLLASKLISTEVSENLTIAMDRAAANGQLAVVKWMTKLMNLRGTEKAIDYAAGHGHKEVVEYLHNTRPKHDATELAMDYAAANGHLDTIVYLHENVKAGCTPFALEEANANGHDDVVEWLEKNGYGKKKWTASGGQGLLRKVLRLLASPRCIVIMVLAIVAVAVVVVAAGVAYWWFYVR